MSKTKKLAICMLVVGFVLLLMSRGAGAAGLEADMVIYNAKILTIDSPDPNGFSIAQAAAIYDGKFIAVGTNEEVLEYAGSSTRKLDLGGRTVIPGLVESHNHIFGYGSHFFPEGSPRVGTTAPAVSYSNKEEFLAQIRTLTLSKKPGEWIVTTLRGGGLGSEDSTKLKLALQRTGELSRFDLDKVSTVVPLDFAWWHHSSGQESRAILSVRLVERDVRSSFYLGNCLAVGSEMCAPLALMVGIALAGRASSSARRACPARPSRGRVSAGLSRYTAARPTRRALRPL